MSTTRRQFLAASAVAAATAPHAFAAGDDIIKVGLIGCGERGSYREDAARQALERTLFWISQYVEGQKPVLLKNAGAYAQAKTEKKKKKKSDDDLGPPMD